MLEQKREGSNVSGVSSLTKISFSSSIRRMNGLAKERELQVKLKYMEQEHKLKEQHERLKRGKELLENMIGIDTAMARSFSI
jgi:hypothetical protein